jgi:hypothetical protein
MIFLPGVVVFTEMESFQPMLNMLSNRHTGTMGVSDNLIPVTQQQRGRASYA